jgi:membrane protein
VLESASRAPLARAGDSQYGQPSESRRRRVRIIRSGGERALALGLSLAVATAVLAAFYRFSVSYSKRVARRVLPGAVLAVVLWLVISWAFGVYVTTLADYAAFYGSLAAVAVLLVWLWLTSFAILVGAELNSQLEGLRD